MPKSKSKSNKARTTSLTSNHSSDGHCTESKTVRFHVADSTQSAIPAQSVQSVIPTKSVSPNATDAKLPKSDLLPGDRKLMLQKMLSEANIKRKGPKCASTAPMTDAQRANIRHSAETIHKKIGHTVHADALMAQKLDPEQYFEYQQAKFELDQKKKANSFVATRKTTAPITVDVQIQDAITGNMRPLCVL